MDGDPTPGFAWVLLASLHGATEYSLIMPTGFDYVESMGGSEFFYGATIAAFPVGRLCCLLPIGYWADRRGCRGPFILTYIVGCFLYGCASAFQCKWMAMGGRFLSGCGATGPLAAWAARAYAPEKRVRVASLQRVAQVFGLILGPCINIFFVRLDVVALDGWLLLNPGTCAGYFPALCYIILLLGFLTRVGEPPREPATGFTGEAFRRLWSSGVWTCLVVAFSTNMQIAAVDTIATPIVSARLGWDLSKISGMFAMIAILSLSGAAASLVADKREVGSLNIMLIGAAGNMLCTSILAACLVVGWERCAMIAFMTSSAMLFVFVMFLAGPTSGIYQQACGGAQGLLGGLYTMAFAAGRPFGAVLGGVTLDGTPLPLSCMLLLAVLASFCLPYWCRQRLNDTVRQALLSSRDLCVEEDA